MRESERERGRDRESEPAVRWGEADRRGSFVIIARRPGERTDGFPDWDILGCIGLGLFCIVEGKRRVVCWWCTCGRRFVSFSWVLSWFSRRNVLLSTFGYLSFSPFFQHGSCSGCHLINLSVREIGWGGVDEFMCSLNPASAFTPVLPIQSAWWWYFILSALWFQCECGLASVYEHARYALFHNECVHKRRLACSHKQRLTIFTSHWATNPRRFILLFVALRVYPY